MISCIFTIDYEVYGDGTGSLRELVYEPAERLRLVFEKWNARFVVFAEVAELEILEATGTDPAIGHVKQQIRQFYDQGFELGLHLHPQWYNGRFEHGRWILDYGEYNLCVLPRKRVEQIVDRAICYFRRMLDVADFSPLSFRAGNWLFQPTMPTAAVLSEKGIRIDSSVFKGGLQHQHKLDYRRSLENGYYWRFQDDVNVPVDDGIFLEFPIYSRMVPCWRMVTAKRMGIQRRHTSSGPTSGSKLYRLMDLSRFRYPLKFDFCRMSLDELIAVVDREIQGDHKDPAAFKPLVAIGHSKDLVDFETVDRFLSYLREKGIQVLTFEEVLNLLVV